MRSYLLHRPSASPGPTWYIRVPFSCEMSRRGTGSSPELPSEADHYDTALNNDHKNLSLSTPALKSSQLNTDDTEHSQSVSSRQRATRNALYPRMPLGWTVEIAASVLSVLSLVGILVFLKRYNGRVVAELDLPKPLTLNGLTAALARFCIQNALDGYASRFLTRR
jgi:hypothetical protein